MKGFDDFDLSAGDVLRGERATHGLDLTDIANKMKLPLSMLLEIEAGCYNSDRPTQLTNNIIRDYANLLGLDPGYIKKLYWDDVDRKTPAKDAAFLATCQSPGTASFNVISIFNRYFKR